MNPKKVVTALWVLVVGIAIASVVCLVAMPHYKGLFFAGSGGFLILNLLLSIAFIKRNYRK